MNFDKLPPEIIVYIAMTMDLPEIVPLCRTSSKFNESICLNKTFWINKLFKDFGISYADVGPNNLNPREYYKWIHKLTREFHFNHTEIGHDNPKTYYDAIVRAGDHYNSGLNNAARNGQLGLVKYFIGYGLANQIAIATNAARRGNHNEVIDYLNSLPTVPTPNGYYLSPSYKSPSYPYSRYTYRQI